MVDRALKKRYNLRRVMPRFLLRFILPVICLLSAGHAHAAAPTVTGYHMTLTGDKTTMRLFLTEAVDAEISTLQNPERVVIDLPGASWKVPPATKGKDAIGAVSKVRNGWPKPGLIRVVLDLNEPVKVEDHYIVPPPRISAPHTLVVVLKPLIAKPLPPVTTVPPFEQKTTTSQAWKKESLPVPNAHQPPMELEVEGLDKPLPPPVSKAGAIEDIGFVPVPKPRPEVFTIVLDPGHGGVDPGAIGRSGIREKEVTLKYARQLRDALENSGRYNVVMTRSDDRYIPLKERVSKAAAAKGHLFISLHADSHADPNTAGLSVYTLSEQASDKEAEALANSENRSAAIAGVELKDDSREVTDVLIDLARRDTKNTSARFAELVVSEIGTEAKLLRNTHRFAGFAVLKGIGVPSVLVELGYLSNPREEEELATEAYRARLVNAIARAVDTYCDQYVLRPDEE